MLVLSMGSGSKDVQAANGNDFDISAPAKVTIGDSFDLTFTLTKATFGYSAYQLRVDDPDGAFNYPGTDWSADDAENQWPPCANAAGTPADGAFFGCAGGAGTDSNYIGTLAVLSMTCKTKGDHDLVLIHNTIVGTNLVDTSQVPDSSDPDDVNGEESITVTCNNPTETPTPTATPTPPPVPQIQKLPALQNLWLVRSGVDKIPPVQCVGPQGGDNYAVLVEQMSITIEDTFPDSKDPSAFQQLGAFEFEIHYDDDKVCVTIEPGIAATNMICVVEDSETKPVLEGVARIGCVTLGKDVTPPDTNTPTGRNLAIIRVRPQPEVYSQAKPNQDNGVMVQINNLGCELADLQGHPIPIFSCEDSDLTIRYLEGDVEPDCQVDVVDQQGIAFRWGVEKGSLIYNDRYNLEPSGAQADNDIDIKDLQFVYGRFGSKCTDPHPPQDPINPKA